MLPCIGLPDTNSTVISSAGAERTAGFNAGRALFQPCRRNKVCVDSTMETRMDMHIEKEAIETLLYGILSCHCPVTEEVERSLFLEYRGFAGQTKGSLLPLAPFLDAAERNPVRTPLHQFLTFCQEQGWEAGKEPLTHNDTIRYFCSRFHFQAILATIDPLRISDPEGHLLGHMLLPVLVEPDGARAVATVSGSEIRLENIFCPADIVVSPGSWAGAHLGMILTVLDQGQAGMVQELLASIEEIPGFAERVQGIDYADYQTFGDHGAAIRDRYERCGARRA